MAIVKDYDHTKGQAFQGDVCIFRVPDKLAKSLDRAGEVAPIEGRLILQAGEFSGHHHAIKLPQPVMFHDGALAREFETAISTKAAARLFRDPQLAASLVNANILTRTDLNVGFLEIEGGPMTVVHEEHDGIRLPDGLYYIGNQIESAGAEERRVVD